MFATPKINDDHKDSKMKGNPVGLRPPSFPFIQLKFEVKKVVILNIFWVTFLNEATRPFQVPNVTLCASTDGAHSEGAKKEPS